MSPYCDYLQFLSVGTQQGGRQTLSDIHHDLVKQQMLKAYENRVHRPCMGLCYHCGTTPSNLHPEKIIHITN